MTYKIISPILFIMCLFKSHQALSMYTELGLSGTYRKTTFNEGNTIDTQTMSGSISFYIWERSAIEFSYTNLVSVRKETIPTLPVRTNTQYSTIAGVDLVLAFSDRKALLQPFVKAGAANINKKQVIQDEGYPAFEISAPPGVAPSAGVGLKIQLTEAFGVQFSYDGWQTPIDDSTKVIDTASRVGVTWIF